MQKQLVIAQPLAGKLMARACSRCVAEPGVGTLKCTFFPRAMISPPPPTARRPKYGIKLVRFNSCPFQILCMRCVEDCLGCSVDASCVLEYSWRKRLQKAYGSGDQLVYFVVWLGRLLQGYPVSKLLFFFFAFGRSFLLSLTRQPHTTVPTKIYHAHCLARLKGWARKKHTEHGGLVMTSQNRIKDVTLSAVQYWSEKCSCAVNVTS